MCGIRCLVQTPLSHTHRSYTHIRTHTPTRPRNHINTPTGQAGTRKPLHPSWVEKSYRLHGGPVWRADSWEPCKHLSHVPSTSVTWEGLASSVELTEFAESEYRLKHPLLYTLLLLSLSALFPFLAFFASFITAHPRTPAPFCELQFNTFSPTLPWVQGVRRQSLLFPCTVAVNETYILVGLHQAGFTNLACRVKSFVLWFHVGSRKVEINERTPCRL